MSNDKVQRILNYTLVTVLIIIFLLFIYSLLGLFGILDYFKDNNMDVLSFTGAIFGGGITFFGVLITIKHQQKIKEEEKKENCLKLTIYLKNEILSDYNRMGIKKDY